MVNIYNYKQESYIKCTYIFYDLNLMIFYAKWYVYLKLFINQKSNLDVLFSRKNSKLFYNSVMYCIDSTKI